MSVLPIVALGVLATAALLAAIWLLLHLNALTAIFSGNADLVRSPSAPRASRAQVYAALAVFNIGWIGSLIVWLTVMATSPGP
jgi:hypothetical protein